MSLVGIFFAAAAAPVPFEEEMALAEDMLREGAGGGASFLGQNAGWLSLIGLVVLAVAVMLIILAGRYRRRGDDFAFQEEPLFEGDGVGMAFDDRYAEVVIEDDAPRDGFAQVMETDTEYQGHSIEENEDVSMASHDEEPARDEDHDQLESERDDADEVSEAEAHPNVVPLRAAPEEPQYADPDDRLPEEEVAESVEPEIEEEAEELEQEQEQPAPRYAFATGRAQAADTSFSHTMAHDGDPTTSGSAHVTSEDRERPFVAPFIRDDIERAERRQSDRLDQLRHEVSSQFETIKAEQSSRLDLVIAAIDRKLDSLDRAQAERYTPTPVSAGTEEMTRNVHSLNDQVARISTSIDSQSQRIRAITQILETKFSELGHVYDEVKTVHEEVKSARSDMSNTGTAIGEVRGDLDEVKEHVGRLERAILDRAAQDSSTTVRLADVVRGTLPDGSYEFAAALANGETADCLIRFEGLRHRIAIDAGFPMEAFHELPSRDAVRRNMPQAKAAEDGFRRAILRSILEAADRCISPGETADSCLLFLPSEAAYTILHDRFPDLVRDSQRARVWLVSPSTLMGTLHLVRSLLPKETDLARREAELSEVRARREEDERLREEVEVLRRRAAGLSEELERTRGTLRGLIGPELGIGGAPVTPSAPAAQAAPAPKAPEQPVAESRSSWGSPTPEARAPREPAPSVHRDADRYDDDEIIESLSFEGTPDWQNPLSRDEKGAPSGFESGLEGPLR